MNEAKENGKKMSLENVAYEELKNAIVVGIYPPGIQIVEEQIANQLNISRSPVRIAIKRLEAEGFLDRYSNKRIYVAFADAKRTVDALYIREALEGMAARLAAINRTQEHIVQLQNLFSVMEQAQAGQETFELYRKGIDVHRLLYAAANNPQLERIGLNTLEQESVFSYRSLLKDDSRSRDMHEEHKKIAKYVIEQDADRAEEAARFHIHKLIERLGSAQPNVTFDSPLRGSMPLLALQHKEPIK